MKQDILFPVKILFVPCVLRCQILCFLLPASKRQISYVIGTCKDQGTYCLLILVHVMLKIRLEFLVVAKRNNS